MILVFISCVNISNIASASENGSTFATDVGKIYAVAGAFICGIPLCIAGLISDNYRPTTCGFLSFIGALSTVHCLKNDRSYLGAGSGAATVFLAYVGFTEHQRIQQEKKTMKQHQIH